MNHAPIALLALSALSPIQAQGYAPRADLEAGRFLKALREAEARIRAQPSEALAWAAKSQSLSSLLRWEEAMLAADRALALQPNLSDGLLARGIARAGRAMSQRNFSTLRGVSQAMDDLRAATQADPTLVRAWMSLGLGYQQLPGIFGGSTRRALQCAEALRRVNSAKGDFLEAMVRSMNGDWHRAEPLFLRALAAAPGDAEIATGWLEQLDEKAALEALGHDRKNGRLQEEATRLLPGLRKWAKGVEAVSEAWLNAGKAEEAWHVALEGLQTAEAPSILRLQLGKVAARSGRHPNEGLAFLDHVLKEPLEGGSGGIPAAHWRRAQILLGLGRKEEARGEAQRTLSLDPHHRGALKLLEALGS